MPNIKICRLNFFELWYHNFKNVVAISDFGSYNIKNTGEVLLKKFLRYIHINSGKIQQNFKHKKRYNLLIKLMLIFLPLNINIKVSIKFQKLKKKLQFCNIKSTNTRGMQGIFATPKDIQTILNVCYRTAWTKYQIMRAAFNIQKPKKVRFSQFLQYFDITEEEYFFIVKSRKNRQD